MKFLVSQIGARRSYAVPAILERAGMLEKFYTDICADVGLGKWLVKGRKLPVVADKLHRLSTRRLPPEIIPKTVTFTGPFLRHALRSILVPKTPIDKFREHLRWSADLGEAMVREGFGNATHLYSMLGEGGTLLSEAHRHGLKVVSEIYIQLGTGKILTEESKMFPGWEPPNHGYDEVLKEFPDSNVLTSETDYAVCPSEIVKEDFIAFSGIAPDRAVVVPYGMNPSFLEIPPQPKRGRVLFIGTADLRKGIHYLAMAAEKIKVRRIPCEFRVAANVAPAIARRSECRHLHFIGRIPRDQVRQEYQQADIFVLPTLAEGSAVVTYEALAAGVPVITTHASGSVVRDGIEGRIVPTRDPDALAEAIEELLENRELRDRMAAAARERAREYTWDRYGDRLVTALRSLPT